MNTIAKMQDRFTETEIDDEIVVMCLDSGEFFSLAGTSAATWRLIDGTRSQAALIDSLEAEFGGDDRQIAADVDEFLSQLLELGLVGYV